MVGLNQMQKLSKIMFVLLFVLQLPIQCFTDAKACRSCVNAAGCERVLRECQAECNSTSFFNEDDYLSCGNICTADLSACTSKAKSACTYDCKEDS